MDRYRTILVLPIIQVNVSPEQFSGYSTLYDLTDKWTINDAVFIRNGVRLSKLAKVDLDRLSWVD